MQERIEYFNKPIKPADSSPPICRFDGHYKRKQFSNGGSWCVDPTTGEEINGTFVPKQIGITFCKGNLYFGIKNSRNGENVLKRKGFVFLILFVILEICS